MQPPKKLKKVATWHNDGTPHGRWEWEPGCEPQQGPPGKFILVLLVLAALLLFASLATAAPPAFTVENKCAPRFEVVNKTPPAQAGCPCAGGCECTGEWRRYYTCPAQHGGTCAVAPPARASEPAPPGYEWVKPAGGQWELRRLAAPEVAAPRPFAGSSTTVGTSARLVGGFSTSSPVPAPFPAPTGIGAFAATSGFTSPGCSSLG